MSKVFHSGSVSGVCCIHFAAVLWLLYPSRQFSVEIFLTCSGECLDLGQNVVSFNQVSFDLLVKRDLMLFPLELKIYRTLWSIDMMQAGGCADLLGEGPTALVLRHTWPRKAVPLECREGRTWCKQCNQSQLALCYLLRQFMLRGKSGNQHQPTPLFLEREVLLPFTVRETVLEERIISPHMFQAFFKLLSPYYLCLGYCLPREAQCTLVSIAAWMTDF